MGREVKATGPLVAHVAERRPAAGEEVVILNRDRPIAKIVALTARTRRDLRGDLKGKIRIAPDFDATPEDFRGYI